MQSKTLPEIVIAVDPGRSKCGIVVACYPPFEIKKRLIAPTERLVLYIDDLIAEFVGIKRLLIGNGTQCTVLRKAITARYAEIEVIEVDEHGSSQRAREKFLKDHAPQGWQRLLPRSLRSPDRPYDDVVAELLANDYFEKNKKECN